MGHPVRPCACWSTPQHTAHPAWMRLSASHQACDGASPAICAALTQASPLPAATLPHCRDVGSMDTHHHTVSVRVKSVLDTCDDEEGPDDGAMQEMKGSQQVGGS